MNADDMYIAIDRICNIFKSYDIYIVGSNSINYINGWLDEDKDIDIIIVGLDNKEIECLVAKDKIPYVFNKHNGLRLFNGEFDLWGVGSIDYYVDRATKDGYDASHFMLT